MNRWWLLAAVGAIWVGGCATTPDPLRDADVEPLSVEAVRKAPKEHIGKRVRWGGSIVAVDNRTDHTVIEVVARPLRESGAPLISAAGQGRFRALVPGFVDPTDYTSDRWLTVVGAVAGTEQGRVGDYAYAFPTVEVEFHKLWRRLSEVAPNAYPYHGYYPWWWDPWYPRYPYPYWPYRPYW